MSIPARESLIGALAISKTLPHLVERLASVSVSSTIVGSRPISGNIRPRHGSALVGDQFGNSTGYAQGLRLPLPLDRGVGG